MVVDAFTVTVNKAGPPPRSSEVSLSVTVRSAGTLVSARLIGLLKPFIGVTVTVTTPTAPCARTRVDGSDKTRKSASGVHVLGNKTACAGRDAKKPSPRISIMNKIFVVIGKRVLEKSGVLGDE